MGKVSLQQNLQTRLAMATDSSPGVCLTPWLDMIEQGELPGKAGQEAISRLLSRRRPAAAEDACSNESGGLLNEV
jgi:hypothetical protein